MAYYNITSIAGLTNPTDKRNIADAILSLRDEKPTATIRLQDGRTVVLTLTAPPLIDAGFHDKAQVLKLVETFERCANDLRDYAERLKVISEGD